MRHNVREVSKVETHSIVKAMGVDWSYWRLIPKCRLYEAVYLALNIDPKKIDFNRSESVEPDEFSPDEKTQALLDVLKRWLEISKSNLLQNGGELEATRYLNHDTLRSEVSINVFGNWAMSIGLDLPDEFPRKQAELVTKSDKNTEQPEYDQPTNQLGGSDPDHENWPDELGIALTAWNAVAVHGQGSGGTPKQRLECWIEKNYNLKPEQIKRIATICNWDKSRGRK